MQNFSWWNSFKVISQDYSYDCPQHTAFSGKRCVLGKSHRRTNWLQYKMLQLFVTFVEQDKLGSPLTQTGMSLMMSLAPQIGRPLRGACSLPWAGLLSPFLALVITHK